MRNVGLAARAAVLVAPILFATGSLQAQEVQSLRGATAIDEADPAPEIHGVIEGRDFGRAYRQQPPLIPHRIDKYEVDLKVNQCLSCHAWPYTQDSGAPKLSETHFTDRDGQPTDEVAKRRWFCTQCHVPQADAPELVGNTFKNALGQ
jgi:cytochrome c-type protein NapB